MKPWSSAAGSWMIKSQQCRCIGCASFDSRNSRQSHVFCTWCDWDTDIRQIPWILSDAGQTSCYEFLSQLLMFLLGYLGSPLECISRRKRWIGFNLQVSFFLNLQAPPMTAKAFVQAPGASKSGMGIVTWEWFALTLHARLIQPRCGTLLCLHAKRCEVPTANHFPRKIIEYWAGWITPAPSILK